MNLDVQLVLLLIASVLLFVALGRPTAELERDVYRFVFTFDVTQSMNVSDAALNGAPLTRLEFAKAAVRRTLQQLPCGSQLGLAIFTEHRSFLLFAPVEVCDNYTAISTMLDKIDWRMAWAARSEVAKGLYSSLSLASSLGKETRVIFLTDGHEAPPVHPEFRPQFSAIPGEISGAIIGIGGSNPMPIPRLNNEGKVMGNWKTWRLSQWSESICPMLPEESLQGLNICPRCARSISSSWPAKPGLTIFGRKRRSNSRTGLHSRASPTTSRLIQIYAGYPGYWRR
jgi:mxaL protein